MLGRGLMLRYCSHTLGYKTQAKVLYNFPQCNDVLQLRLLSADIHGTIILSKNAHILCTAIAKICNI